MNAPVTLEFSGRGIVLDIEGTTSSVSFVYDVMFPYVRRELDNFLAANWDKPAVAAACERIAKDAGAQSLSAFAAGFDPRAKITGEVLYLMDLDSKATGLKELQGLIWENGFNSGELSAHVYPDVPPALKAWHQARMDIRVYSSGSIAAQKLFFGHTEAGNLLPFFRGHYDTTTGPKRAAASYAAIAADMHLPEREILFLSDVAAELDAARQAGYVTGLVVRPETSRAQKGQGGVHAAAKSRFGSETTALLADWHPAITAFSQITLGRHP